jgi:hypothetical protein
MDEGENWGTSFSDEDLDRYVIQLTQEIEIGKIIAYTEIIDDQGASLKTKKDEDNDDDKYSIGAELGFGDIMIMPLLSYKDTGNDTDIQTTEFNLAVITKLKNINIESEFDYINVDGKNASDDYDNFGLMVNVNTNFDIITVGGILAYGNTDDTKKTDGSFQEEKPFSFGTEWNTLIILTNEDGKANEVGMDLAGFTMAKFYVNTTINDQMSINAAFAYINSNFDHNNGDIMKDKDTDGMEFDLTGSYKITNAVTYSAGLGYLAVNTDENNGIVDPDGMIRAYHEISINF